VFGWLNSLSTLPLAAVVCLSVAIVALLIFVFVTRLAAAGHAPTFSAVSPGMLPPMSLVFGLVVGFLAAEVWSAHSSAQQAVDSEASAIRSVDMLIGDFTPADRQRMDALIRDYIDDVVDKEWPAMANQDATLLLAPPQMAAALALALHLPTSDSGQVVAQREIVARLQDALDARRQRIIISDSSVNAAKWTAVFALGILTLVAVAFVHSANRKTAALAITLFASAIAVSMMMISVQDRPFAGPFRVEPTPLIQVQPAPA
jgi:hypothetical protein